MARLRPAYRKAYQTALKMYWDHIRAKGWADKMVLYISDEPTFWAKGIKARIAAICQMIQEVDPSIPIYSSTWHHIPEWNGLVTVWGAGSYGCFPTDKMEEVRRIGSRLWFTTDGQMTLSTPYCAEEQLLPIYATFHGAEQYEYWGSTWVTLPPWRFGWHDYVSEGMGIRTTNGGGFVAYPPCPDTDDPRPCPKPRTFSVIFPFRLFRKGVPPAIFQFRGPSANHKRPSEPLRGFLSGKMHIHYLLLPGIRSIKFSRTIWNARSGSNPLASGRSNSSTSPRNSGSSIFCSIFCMNCL